MVAAAFLHAAWNLLAKRAGAGLTFVWLFSLIASILYAPIALWVLVFSRPHLGTIQLLFLGGAAVLHTAYYLLLQRGYRRGDLSVVYPSARGTGAVLASVGAVVVLGERPSAIALAGTLLVFTGVLLLAGGGRIFREGFGRSATTGIYVGLLIAVYTLWDGHAVRALLIPPILLDWSSNAGRALLLAPFAMRRQAEIRETWERHRLGALGVAVLAPATYLLVLTALQFAPISYVAPTREISILVGVAMGARLLGEESGARRLVAAGVIVAGIAALTLGTVSA